MELFKKITNDKLITIQKRGAVVNYEPITINEYEFFEVLWKEIEKSKPELINTVESDFKFLSDNGNYDDLKDFMENSDKFKNEDSSVMCEFNNFISSAGYLSDSLTRFTSKERFSKNNVICRKESCLTYLQVYNEKLYIVSRSLEISNFFLYDALMVKILCDKFDCKEIKWEIIAPFDYVENVLLNSVETLDDLLNKQFIVKNRKGVK